MKAYQVWLVARDPATLQDIGRALLQESDSRENCEIYNEALTVADKVNLARSYFGRAVHAFKPLYVVQTLPNNCLPPQSLEKQMEALGARLFLSPGKIRANVDWLNAVVPVRHREGERRKGIVTRATLRCAGQDVVHVSFGTPQPSLGTAAPWIEGEVVPAPSPQLCQCGPQQYVMVSTCRCGRCGKAIK